MQKHHARFHPTGGAACALLLGLLASGALAQLVLAAIPPEIPLVQRMGLGARALGMGGAYVAVAEDYTALAYNPAGLAQIRRVEFAGALSHTSADQVNTFLGNQQTTPLSKSNLESIGFAYPFPTYRGSLVIGFSYDRAVPLDMAYYRAGRGGLVADESEEMLEDGSMGAWRAGVAAEMTQGLSLGATAVLYAGNSTRDRTFVYRGANGIDREDTHTTTSTDYSAVSGTLGAMIHSAAGLRFGLALHLPEKIHLSGTADDSVDRLQQTPPDTLSSSESFDFDENIELPFRFAAGISYVPRGKLSSLLVSVDATYADWSQIDYNGPIRTLDRGYAYRATTDVRVGAEYTFTGVPLRLRAGFISQPLAYRLIGTDVFLGGYGQARMVSDRRYGTIGLGYLVQESLTLDVAYVFGGYERSGHSSRLGAGGDTIEKIKDRRAYFGAAFRL